jgi:UDP-N-acetylglucosamine 2-epimerase
MKIGRFYVHGAHCAEPVPAGMVALQVDAGAAFGSGEHGTTSACLKALDWLAKYADYTRILDMGCGSGILAIAAAKLHIPVIHVEAGLRSFNMRMPEEINRILSDRISKLLLCPTTTSVENLNREGLTQGVHLVGDVMFDVSLFYSTKAKEKSSDDFFFLSPSCPKFFLVLLKIISFGREN